VKIEYDRKTVFVFLFIHEIKGKLTFIKRGKINSFYKRLKLAYNASFIFITLVLIY